MTGKYINHSDMFIDLRKKILEKSFSFLNPMQLQAVFEINGRLQEFPEQENIIFFRGEIFSR